VLNLVIIAVDRNKIGLI